MQASTLGTGLVYLAFALGVLTTLALARRRAVAETLWSLTTGTVVAATLLLMGALVRSDFSVDYVVGHTSRDLATAYKVAALWAGQEGTNLLWVFITLWVVAALWRRRDREPLAWPAATLVMAMALGLLSLLVVRSPFAPVTDGIPKDGRGLNPLLENPWMIIHPPVLFIGYSLLFAPFALALAGWWRGDGVGWTDLGRRYTLWGWVLLGAGMMLGGYWAYVTLGWGGFWAWDPVENASLVPWLTATALLHGLSVQRRGGAAARLNFVTAMICQVVIIYGAYLTRSGVLADFSVHSFADLGAAYNNAWLTLLFVPLVAGLFVYARCRRKVAAATMPDSSTWLLAGLWLLLSMTLLIWIGMSMPLLSKMAAKVLPSMFDEKGHAVQMGYYNQTQTLLFIVATVALLLHLKPRGRDMVVAMVGSGLYFAVVLARCLKPEVTSTNRLALILAALSAGAMLGAGVVHGWRGRRMGLARQVGTGLSHAGIALVVLGALISVNGERMHKLDLAQGVAQKTPYGEVRFDTPEETPNGRLKLPISLGGKRKISMFFQTEQGQMRNPVLFHHVWGDVYLAPEGLSDPNTVTLKKGEKSQAGGCAVTFHGYELGGMHNEGGKIRVGAKLTVDDGSGAKDIVPAWEMVGMSDKKSLPAMAGTTTFELVSLDVDSGSVTLSVVPKAGGGPGGPHLSAVMTIKPSIWLVWLGTLVLLMGGLVGLSQPRATAPSTA